MKFKKLVIAESRMPADVDRNHGVNFPRQRDTLAPATRRIVALGSRRAGAAERANVQRSAESFEVRFIANHRRRIAKPTEKFCVVANPNQLTGFVIDFGYFENILILSVVFFRQRIERLFRALIALIRRPCFFHPANRLHFDRATMRLCFAGPRFRFVGDFVADGHFTGGWKFQLFGA